LVDISGASSKSSDEHGSPSLGQLDIAVDDDRTVRMDSHKTALVVVDMQNFFLDPRIRKNPQGLKCVEPLLKVIPAVRTAGCQIIWLNWGLTTAEIETMPPALVRSFGRHPSGGFGFDMGDGLGKLLMRGEFNSDLYGSLKDEYERGLKFSSRPDVWIHKNRMSGIWGPGTALETYLRENGITTLLFAGINTDQCVMGTLVDAYNKGFDCILASDLVGTASPGGQENVEFNCRNAVGFVTDANRILKALV